MSELQVRWFNSLLSVSCSSPHPSLCTVWVRVEDITCSIFQGKSSQHFSAETTDLEFCSLLPVRKAIDLCVLLLSSEMNPSSLYSSCGDFTLSGEKLVRGEGSFSFSNLWQNRLFSLKTVENLLCCKCLNIWEILLWCTSVFSSLLRLANYRIQPLSWKQYGRSIKITYCKNISFVICQFCLNNQSLAFMVYSWEIL